MSNSQGKNLENENMENEKKSILKDFLVIGGLLLASFISVFGIYNVYGGSLVSFISSIDNVTEQIGNYILLTLYTGTMFYLSSLYWKKKEVMSKMKIIFVLLGVLSMMIVVMLLMINNFLYPLISLVIVGISFFLFNMLFNTIGIVGVFSTVTLFSVFLIFMIKSGIEYTGSFLFTSIQVLLSLLLFLGTTYPRIRSMLFKIGTRDNVDIDGGMNTRNDDDDDDGDD